MNHNFAARVFASLSEDELTEIDAGWFDKLDQAAKQAYIRLHPQSKYAKYVRRNTKEAPTDIDKIAPTKEALKGMQKHLKELKYGAENEKNADRREAFKEQYNKLGLMIHKQQERIDDEYYNNKEKVKQEKRDSKDAQKALDKFDRDERRMAKEDSKAADRALKQFDKDEQKIAKDKAKDSKAADKAIQKFDRDTAKAEKKAADPRALWEKLIGREKPGAQQQPQAQQPQPAKPAETTQPAPTQQPAPKKPAAPAPATPPAQSQQKPAKGPQPAPQRKYSPEELQQLYKGGKLAGDYLKRADQPQTVQVPKQPVKPSPAQQEQQQPQKPVQPSKPQVPENGPKPVSVTNT